jgi:uncharacterized protein HemX
MKLPRLRFTVRAMVVLVAILAVSIASFVSVRRGRLAAAHRATAARYTALAQGHRNGAAGLSDQADLTAIRAAMGREDARSEYDLREVATMVKAVKGMTEWARQAEALALRYEALAKKYVAAASSPELPVAPDPLEPK